MPIVNLHKEGAEKIINDYQSHMKPAAYELVFNDDNEEMLRLIRKDVIVVPSFSLILCGLNFVEVTMTIAR